MAFCDRAIACAAAAWLVAALYTPPQARAWSAIGSAAPQELRLGRLTLRPCQIGGRTQDGLPTVSAYCSAFSVPEDWRQQRGRHISLKVAVISADAASPDPDMVAFLDGGPGGAATDDYPAIAPALGALRARHAILLIDQRGTGGSNALTCSAPSEPTPAQEADPPDDPATIEQWVRQCLAELKPHAAPQFYTTTAAVHDLEAVREALGSPALDLIAVSYGTRVAQQYAATYPASVRSLVLDSPVPNRVALLSDHARNLEHALRGLFGRCRATPACAQRFGDPYATLYRVRARLRAHPQTVQLRDPVSFEPRSQTLTADDLAAVVRFYTYNSLSAALLPLMLQRADSGDYAALLGQKQWLARDLGAEITGAVELSVLCAEDADLLSARPQDQDTLLGNSAIRRAQAACALWPKGTRPANFHAALISSLPALVLSGEFDPVTPPDYGRAIVQGLSRGRLLIASGQGHGVLSAGCMPKLVEHFITTLAPRRLDDACLRRLGDTPAFLDYNGPGP
jgi:pimeloyl-ACP methyl ester carboxylesterase